jgi:hypothetical protein
MSEDQLQEKSTPGKYVFGAFPLYEHKTPEFRESNGYPYIKYGDDNSYPDYLVYLYNRSAIHNAIVNGKTRFILGRGWQPAEGAKDANLSRFMGRVNPSDTLNDLTYKTILDRLIFGGYALRVLWMGGKITTIYHQPFQTIRTNVEQTEYYVSKEWTRDQSTKARFKAGAKLPDDVRMVKPFDPTNPVGEQILYICDYRPMLKIYPLPEYIPANAAIETDVEIDNFHLNNIKSGFAAGTMITLFNGKPAPEQQKKVERDLKDKFFGTDNAGEGVIYYAELNETPPLITPLRSNELDKQYDQLAKSTIEKIFIGHNVTSPMLFGVKTEGQLGGRSEMDIAWELMNINYVDPRRQQFESDFNYVLQFAGMTTPVELQPLKGLNMEISEQMIAANLTREEQRELISDALGIELKEVVNQPQALSKDKIEEFESILINKFSQLGISPEGLEFADIKISDDDKKLINYIKGKDTIDITKAKKDLGIDVEKILKRLIENNVVQAQIVSGKIVDIKDIQEPEQGVEVVTMWKYSGPQDDKNRSFCAKMLRLGKLYTREEIDQLNNEMQEYNTDVWKYRGGWYTVPDTDGLLHTPYCRHSWNQVLVKRNK